MSRRKRREKASPGLDAGLRPGELVPLADGPVARVLAGVDEVTGEAYALKVLPGKLETVTRATVESELFRLGQLRSVAPLLVASKLVAHDGASALRMELCAQSLPDLIGACGPLSVGDALALGESVAGALAAAHQVEVVHGSVTPSNVLFRETGEALLADAGVALRAAFPATGPRDVTCLAPETLRDGAMSRAADVYGIGAILYLGLTAAPPHGGDQGGGRARVVDFAPPQLTRGDLPRELPALLTALLAPNPSARPVDAGEVAALLRGMAAGVATGSDLHNLRFETPGRAGSFVAPVAEFDDFNDVNGPVAVAAPLSGGSGIAAAFDDFALPTPVRRPAPPVRPAAVHRPPARPTPTVAVAPREPDTMKIPAEQIDALSGRRPLAAQLLTTSRPTSAPSPADRRGTEWMPHPPPQAGKPPVVQLPPAPLPRPDGSMPGAPPPRPAQFGDVQFMPTTEFPALKAARTTGRKPVVVFDSQPEQRRGLAYGMVPVAAALALCVGTLAAVIIMLNGSDDPVAPLQPPAIGQPSSQAAPEPAQVALKLNEPIDRGDYVNLSWDSSQPLEYAVIVADEKGDSKAVLAHGKNTLRVKVNPRRVYCFAVQGTDGTQVYESDQMPIRGATCAD